VPVDGGVPDAGQQVGPEGELPVDHPGQGGEHLGEALGHGVLGVGRRAGGGAGHPPGGVVVSEVERPERAAVPLARLQHQLAVAEQRGTGEIGGSRGVAQNVLEGVSERRKWPSARQACTTLSGGSLRPAAGCDDPGLRSGFGT
jgi:hypothetical protein